MKELIHKGSLISVYRERVEFKNGGHSYFDIVKHPGAAVIAATNDNNEICLLKQWRHAIQQNIWEFPAGCLEQDEAPLQTAKRELEEEAGVVAKLWLELGIVYPCPGFSDEILHFYAATDLHQGQLNLDEGEQLEAHWLSMEQVNKMVKSGEITDAKTLALLIRLQL